MLLIGKAVCGVNCVETMLRKLYRASLDGIVVTDTANRIIDVNPAYEYITGYAREELLGNDPGMIKSGRTPPATYADMWAHLEARGAWMGELINRRKDGSEWISQISITKVVEGCEVAGYIGVSRDITQRKLMEERLHHQAVRDELTGLFNHRFFYEQLQVEIERAKRARGSVGLLMLDIDRFKAVNDRFGHVMGDEVLRAVGRTIQAAVRVGDTACRYGGEEFAVIMPGADAAAVEALGERIRAAVEATSFSFMPGEPDVRVTISVGSSIYPTLVEDDRLLVKAADLALYLAKERGRNRVCLASWEEGGLALQKALL